MSLTEWTVKTEDGWVQWCDLTTRKILFTNDPKDAALFSTQEKAQEVLDFALMPTKGFQLQLFKE